MTWATTTRTRLSVAGLSAIAATAGVLATAPAAFATEAPTITQPTDGQTLCVALGGSVDVSGTAPAGSTVTIKDGGSDIESVVADATSGAWTDALALGAGDHSLTASADDGSGPSVDSPAVSVTVVTQTNAAVSVTPATISPANRDGVKDVATLKSVAPADGTMQLSIVKNGTTVRATSPKSVGQGDTATFAWNGRNTNGAFVASGTYRATLTWQQSGCATASASKPVVVDNVAPSASTYDKNYATFFPRRDDAITSYRNSEVLAARHLSEAANVRLQLFKGAAATSFKSVALGTLSKGTTAKYAWNGRHSNGALYPAGTYKFRFVLRDGVGNVRTTGKQSFTLSDKHIVARTASVQRTGVNYSHYVDNTACGFDMMRSADYARGIWLNYCGYSDSDGALVYYNFVAPKATVYGAIHPYLYGTSDFGGNPLPCVMAKYAPSDYVLEYGAQPTNKLHWLTKRSGAHFVSSGGRSQLVVGFAGSGDYDYSIKYIGIQYRYGVLAS